MAVAFDHDYWMARVFVWACIFLQLVLDNHSCVSLQQHPFPSPFLCYIISFAIFPIANFNRRISWLSRRFSQCHRFSFERVRSSAFFLLVVGSLSLHIPSPAIVPLLSYLSLPLNFPLSQTFCVQLLRRWLAGCSYRVAPGRLWKTIKIREIIYRVRPMKFLWWPNVGDQNAFGSPDPVGNGFLFSPWVCDEKEDDKKKTGRRARLRHKKWVKKGYQTVNAISTAARFRYRFYVKAYTK